MIQDSSILAALRGLCQEISNNQSTLTTNDDSKRLVVPFIALLDRIYDVSSRYTQKVGGCLGICRGTMGTVLRVGCCCHADFGGVCV